MGNLILAGVGDYFMFIVLGAFVVIMLLVSFAQAKRRGKIGSAAPRKASVSGSSNGFVINYLKGKGIKRRKTVSTVNFSTDGINLTVENSMHGVSTVALDSLYSTHFSVKRKPLVLLVLGIVIALLGINFAIATKEAGLLALMGLGLLLVILWFLIKQSVHFSVYFGGEGKIVYALITNGEDAHNIIAPFLANIMSQAQTERDSASLAIANALSKSGITARPTASDSVLSKYADIMKPKA